MAENLPVKVEADAMPFWLMDRLDDELIVQELEGRLPAVLTYHFTDRATGKEIWGVSKSGVDEATAELAMKGEVIREVEVNMVDREEEALFTVKSGRYVLSKDGTKEVLLDTKFGFKRQPKKTPSGGMNPFWYEQGAIKAARNASMRLIPKAIIQGVIAMAKLRAEEGNKEVVKEVDDSMLTPNSKQEAVEMVQQTFPDAIHLSQKLTEYMHALSGCKTLQELSVVWKEKYQDCRALPKEMFDQLEAQKNHLKTQLK